MIKAKPPFPNSRHAAGAASRAGQTPHRNTNQAHVRDADASFPGAREAAQAGSESPGDTDGTANRPYRPDRPGRSGVLPAGCPIADDFNLVLDLSEDLNRAMRQLRRKLAACGKCPLDDACGFRRAFQKQVDLAIQEITGEWGLP